MNFENLFKKGWNEREVRHAKGHLIEGRKTLWAVLVTVIGGNLICSLLVFVLSLFFIKWAVYGFVVVLAAMMGHVFSKLLEHARRVKFIELGAGLVAFVNFVMAIFVSNYVKGIYGVEYYLNPWLFGLVFSVIFIVGRFVKT